MWRDLTLTGGALILGFFCPPAGGFALLTLSGADLYSAFSGSGDIDNLVAMHKDINRNGGAWYEMEKSWRDALNEVPPKKVSVNIEPIYADGSLRPTEFKVSYQIEGKRRVETIIRNQAGG